MLLCVLVAAGAAYLYANQQDPRYEASTNLLLRDPTPGPNAAFGNPTPNTGPDREALVLSETVKARRGEASWRHKLGGALRRARR